MKNFVHGSIRKETYRVRLEHADTMFPGQWAEKIKGSGMRWIYRLAVKFCKGKGLDVGPCGVVQAGSEFRAFPGAIPVDIRLPDSGSATDLSKHADDSMDYVFSSHCLEHVNDPEKALEEFYRVLKPGGIAFIYLPAPGHYAWDPSVCADARVEHLWQPTPDTLGRLLLMTGFKLEYLEREADACFSFTAIGRK
jgi:SAM-dependent methyltransferase